LVGKRSLAISSSSNNMYILNRGGNNLLDNRSRSRLNLGSLWLLNLLISSSYRSNRFNNRSGGRGLFSLNSFGSLSSSRLIIIYLNKYFLSDLTQIIYIVTIIW
jgi:hypothetical protein